MAGGGTTNNSGVRKRRKAPFPQNSILDRAALQEALDSRGISLKRLHMDAFYQALHRQHYPPLPQFVETYYKHEDVNNTYGNNNDNDNDNEDTTTTETIAPLKNKVSSKKCKNKLQLPKAFLEYLRTTNEFATLTSKIKKELTSKNTLTTKLVIELYDGQVIESVIMRFDSKGVGRASLCVSSQCGCAMGCTFCATGTMGLSGNLTSAEILEQLVHANSILAKDYVSSLQQQVQQQEQEDPNIAGHGNGNNITSKKKNGNRKRGLHLVRNVVFMGQGEPLDNYTHVVNACRAMMDTRRWNLKHEHVTISTVGLVSQIRKLTKDLPEVSLALSLHAPNQALRTSIVPTASRYPIESLIDALDNHMLAGVVPTNPSTATGGDSTVVVTEEDRIKASSKRRAMIEYVMLEGETSSLESAHQLGRLCEARQLIINLIPYNATDVKDKHQCPSEERIQEFRAIVASYGAFCTVRRTMGADIASACGQLVTKVKQEEGEGKQIESAVRDIEDVLSTDRTPTNATLSVKKSTRASPSSQDGQEPQKQQGRVTHETNSFLNGFSSWLESITTEDLNQWEQRLTVASTVAASCFLVSSVLLLRKHPR